MSAKENHALLDMGTARKPTGTIGDMLRRSLKPQIEQYPSVRTICPGEGCREHPKKEKCRCGNSSVAAAFSWPDSEKALKSRAFGQNEKVGNFYQNYLPFVAEGVGFEPTDRLITGQTISSRSRYDRFDSPPNMSIPILS